MTADFSITKASQEITFDALIHTDVVFDLIASASSGLTITYTSSDINVTTISRNKVTVLTAGYSIITAYQSVNNNYETAISVTQVLTIQTLGIDTSLLSNVNIYPNPASNYLSIQRNNNLVAVSICDVLGKKVISEKNNNKIDVKLLPNGVYIIRISNGFKEVRKKFIKN